ncbi:GrdX family protein [Wansuia hejianensis]|uniref:GrdX family protein n=1 Tax=Wansuia hejianensis TaxID=2763667 RepID=A0A926IGK9_9FIRM|nr:GrdX family protein [Wansuia hejianensis]MBC8589692.1 GrdX family protein [Wansuia hejianensis]
MSNIIITNNQYVYEKYKDTMDIIYNEKFSYMEILSFVRDKIHEGHKLLTHPLSGSIKPNETPYKTILISKDKKELDMEGLKIIEESILTARKFQEDKITPNWTEKVLDDFRVIDLSLIENVIKKLG